MESNKDLEGNVVNPGELPGFGTRLKINGKTFRIIYTRFSDGRFRFTAELID